MKFTSYYWENQGGRNISYKVNSKNLKFKRKKNFKFKQMFNAGNKSARITTVCRLTEKNLNI